MKSFYENFYTDDYDQEVLDFIEENYTASDRQWDINGDELVYGTGNEYFWTNTFSVHEPIVEDMYGHLALLTKEQFKEKIGMTNKTYDEGVFTKDMLVAGKHVVEVNSSIGCKELLNVAISEEGVYLQGNDSVYPVEVFEDDITIPVVFASGIEVWVGEVYLIKSPESFRRIRGSLTSIWKRPPEKTTVQKELEEKIAVTRKNLLELEKLLEANS